jgi:hypothetical protein
MAHQIQIDKKYVYKSAKASIAPSAKVCGFCIAFKLDADASLVVILIAPLLSTAAVQGQWGHQAV